MPILPVVLTTLNRGTQSVIPYIEEMVEAIGAEDFEIVTEGVSIFSGGVNRPRRVRFLKNVHGTLKRGDFMNLEFNFIFNMVFWRPESKQEITARFLTQDSMDCFIDKKNDGQFGELRNLPDIPQDEETIEVDEFPEEGLFFIDNIIISRDGMGC